jgi:hypothetical protein
MDYPTLLTLTIENVDDLKRGKEAVQGAFGCFRATTNRSRKPTREQ